MDGFDKFQETFEAQFSLAESRTLLESAGQELRLDICPGKGAAALHKPFLNNAHKQLPRLYEIKVHALSIPRVECARTEHMGAPMVPPYSVDIIANDK